MLAHKIND